MSIKARDLIGRTITAVDFRTFATGREREKTTNPVLTLDNGRKLWFVVAETETGDYGVECCLTDRRHK